MSFSIVRISITEREADSEIKSHIGNQHKILFSDGKRAIEMTKSTSSLSSSLNKYATYAPSHSDTEGKLVAIKSNFVELIPDIQSPFAYATLLHGIDDTFKYRGFLYNTLIMKKSLEDLGSKYDFIALIGFSSTYHDENRNIFQQDFDLLKSSGIKLFFLPRLKISEFKDKKLSFAEMALLKITPWSFIQYKKVQFFDGDIMPIQNMDCFFDLPGNTFNTGFASPLNSGWFVATPNLKHYNEMMVMAKKRLDVKWDEIMGWGREIPKNLYFRGSDKAVVKYNFNGASLDQGLLMYYFAMNNGNATLIDVSEGRVYTQRFSYKTLPLTDILHCCPRGRIPIKSFAHFTGKNKPWLKDVRKSNDKIVMLWGMKLDKLKLTVNSSNIHEINLAPSLGYFFPNK